MSELTPITRKETFLAKVGGQNVVTPTPITREETFLQAIIDNGSGGGTGGGVLVVNDNNGTLDKTWQEITNAGFAIILDDSLQFAGTQILALARFKADEEESEYVVAFISLFNTSAALVSYIAESAEGYPTLSE